MIRHAMCETVKSNITRDMWYPRHAMSYLYRLCIGIIASLLPLQTEAS